MEFSNSYLYMRGYSKSTINNYRWAITSLSGVIGDVEIESLSLQDLLRWRHHLDQQAWSKNAINAYCYKIRLFLRYWKRKGLVNIELEDFYIPKKEQKLPTYLTLDQAKVVYGSCATQRERVILSILFSTGIRVGELVSIRVKDIRDDKILIRGKGSRERYVYLDDTCKELIQRYLEDRNSTCPFLFPSKKGGGLSKSAFQKIIRDIGQRADIGVQLTPHVFRHTYATLMLKQGCNLRHIQSMLGHADISTTQIYTHVTDNDVARAFTKYHVELV